LGTAFTVAVTAGVAGGFVLIAGFVFGATVATTFAVAAAFAVVDVVVGRASDGEASALWPAADVDARGATTGAGGSTFDEGVPLGVAAGTAGGEAAIADADGGPAPSLPPRTFTPAKPAPATTSAPSTPSTSGRFDDIGSSADTAEAVAVEVERPALL
jgi:hypothetical protein